MTGFAQHPRFELKIIDPRVGTEWRFDYQSEGAAGIDLVACMDRELILHHDDRESIGAGVAVWMKDPDYVMLITTRSGLGCRGLVLQHSMGVIDADYQEQILIPLMNIGDDPIVIRPGDRVAQALFMPVVHPVFQVVSEFSAVTKRGRRGWGSTGMSSAIDCSK